MISTRDAILDLWIDGDEVHFIATKLNILHERVRNVLNYARTSGDPRALLREDRPSGAGSPVRMIGDIRVMTWSLKSAPWVQVSLPYVSIIGEHDHGE